MAISSYKELLSQVKCGKVQSQPFSEDDLRRVKACLPEPVSPVGLDFDVPIETQTSCLNDGIKEIESILNDELSKQGDLIELCTVKAKVEELRDNYKFALLAYSERKRFFTDTVSTVEPITSEYLYWDGEDARLRALESTSLTSLFGNSDVSRLLLSRILELVRDLSDSKFYTVLVDLSNLFDVLGVSEFLSTLVDQLIRISDFRTYAELRRARIEAEQNRLRAKNGATRALSQAIDKIQALPETQLESQALISEIVNKYSSKLIPHFAGVLDEPFEGLIVPSRSLAFSVELVNLERTKISVPKKQKDGKLAADERTINIKNNRYVNSNCFSNTLATSCKPTVSLSKTVYDTIKGYLYNGVDQSYVGLYRKLKNPINYLYTLEERGLTVNPENIDPTLLRVKDAPVTIKSEDFTYYIANQETFETFYSSLEKTLPERIKTERERVFPSVIKSISDQLIDFARREVADHFRRIDSMPLKLARPTSYVAGESTIFSQGKFNFDKVDSALGSLLSYYTKSHDELVERIALCESEIAKIEKLIADSSLSETKLTEKVSKIKCFKDAFKSQPTSKDCESKVLAKLGTDPFGIRTLSGNDPTMPDATTLCYWKEFAKSLSKVSILPVPDSGSPMFRYYPVNNLIPTPAGISLITLPPKWKPLFVLPTPLGILVTFITLPVAIVGIPLPSIYVMFISPDGAKYVLLAPNAPVLYSSPSSIKYGFLPDFSAESDSPVGLIGPFKGNPVKGALSSNLLNVSTTSRAARIAKVAADVAIGNSPKITTRDGTPIGNIALTDYLRDYLSTAERMKNGADSSLSKSMDRQIAKFKRNINRQFDRLGDAQMRAVTQLKDKVRTSRQSGVDAASQEKDLAKKREGKKLARSLDPLTLQTKINGVLADFEDYIDKIKLGTIRFPDDATVFNPKLPGSVTGLISLLDSVSNGGAANDKDSSKLLKKIKRIAASLDEPDQEVFNLRTATGLAKFKDALKNRLGKAVAKLSGEYTDSNLTDEERKSQALRNKRLKTALAFTSLSVTSPKLKLFDPTAPCCPREEKEIDLSLSPQVQAAISVLITLFNAYLDGLTLSAIRQALGDNLDSIGSSAISIMFNEIINTIPPINLPEKPDILSIVKALFLPIIQAITIPQSVNPLGVPYPFPIVIPLDQVVKPLLKIAVAYLLELLLRMLSDAGDMLSYGDGSNSSLDKIIKQIPCGNSELATVYTTSADRTVTVELPNGITINLPKIPNIPLDLIGYFALLTSTDLIELIRGMVLAAIDGILRPIKEVIDPILAVVGSLKDLSYTIFEAGNPYVAPIKLALMAVQLQIPPSVKLKISNQDAINAIKAIYVPLVEKTEPVLKNTAYLAAILACAFGGGEGVKAARIAANPFFNQDDLPPWERLTHKNPLFAIFLDEIAWRSSLTSTGTLLFQTKTPGLYPSAWTPSIFSDSGAVYH